MSDTQSNTQSKTQTASTGPDELGSWKPRPAPEKHKSAPVKWIVDPSETAKGPSK